MSDVCGYSARPALACPADVEMYHRAISSLLPPGWAMEAVETKGTLLHDRAHAIAALLTDFHNEACALLPEFHCFSADRTLDDWMIDYGLPDACGINDLCIKLAAQGDGTCASLVELGALLGFDVCCNEFPVEIQAGCWDLGFEEMPPQPDFGPMGIDLGYLGLACAPSRDGAPEHDGDCIFVGYYEAADVAGSDPACAIDAPCRDYAPMSDGYLITGCRAEIDHTRYVGTAYHFSVALNSDQPNALPEGDWAVMGCWETGCTPLCTPPASEVMCFILSQRHAHTKPVRAPSCHPGYFSQHFSEHFF